MKAQDARSNAVAEQGRKTQEFTQQSAQYVEAARKHYDAAEKLNIPDYQEKEDAFMQLVPPAVGADIMRLFPEKSAALMYHPGKPEKARQLLAMDGQSALIELTRLSERLTLKPRGKQISSAPLLTSLLPVMSAQQIKMPFVNKWMLLRAREMWKPTAS